MSDHDWKQTPTLDDFAAMYDADDNLWWRIGSGHHLNLYEAARERYEAAEVVIQAVRELRNRMIAEWPTDTVNIGVVIGLLDEALDGPQ